jgi:outer membrane receptor protein involved in Fe transport
MWAIFYQYTRIQRKINAHTIWFQNKFSYLFGLRWEDTNIDVNLLGTQEFNNKKYNKFFPSAFATYEISDKSSVSLSYSKRLSRPRGRFLDQR